MHAASRAHGTAPAQLQYPTLIQRGSRTKATNSHRLLILMAVCLSQSLQCYWDSCYYTEIPLLLLAILGHSNSPLGKQHVYIPVKVSEGPLESILRACRTWENTSNYVNQI